MDTLTGRYEFRLRWISQGDDLNYNPEKDYVTSWKQITIEMDQVFGVTIETEDENMDVEVGKTVQFKVTVQNQGNDDDTFRIKVTELDETDSWGSLSKSKVTLDALGSTSNDKTEITLTIRVPNDNEEAIAGNYRFQIDVERDSNNKFERQLAMDSLIVSVDVEKTYSHNLESDEDQEDAQVGEKVSFRFKVINKGNSRDVYELDIKGTKREWGTLSAEFVTLDPEEETYVYLNVTVPLLEEDAFDPTFPHVDDPEDVEAGKYDFDIEVQSRGDRDADPEIITFTVDVEQEFSVIVSEVDDGGESNDPYIYDVNDKREDLKLRFTLENRGNKDDTFYIKKPNAPTGWDIQVSPDHPRVPLGEAQEITVTITFSQTSGFEDGKQPLRFEIWPDDGSINGRNARIYQSLYVDAQVPELVMGKVKVPKNADLAKDESVDIEIPVTNSGKADAEDVTVTVSVGGNTFTSDSQDIPNGSTKTFKIAWTPGATGDFTIKAEIDQGLIEVDEDNNDDELERSVSAFNLRNYIGYQTLLIILVILALIAIVIIVGLAYNRNKEIKELESLVERMKTDRSTGPGPRKVIKEASGTGAPAAPPAKTGPGLPSAPGALAPVAGPTGGKLQSDSSGKKEAVKVKCPQCKTQQVVSIDKRPAEIPCKECGVTLLIPEKK